MNGMVALLLIVAPAAIFADVVDNWSIQAGQVEISVGGKPQVTGTFYVRAPSGTPADTVTRTGGACLLADLVPFGVGLESCTSNADCNTPQAIDKANHPQMDRFLGYCVVRDSSDELPRCWTRPGPPQDYCKRSIDGHPLTPGAHQLPMVPADPLDHGELLPDWAVFACMADEGHPTACGQPVSDHRRFSMTPLIAADGMGQTNPTKAEISPPLHHGRATLPLCQRPAVPPNRWKSGR